MATLTRGLLSQQRLGGPSFLLRRIGGGTWTNRRHLVPSASLSARWMSSYPPHEVVGMPSLSPTMESGQIARWNKGEGEEFIAGDIFCEVQTDKATVDFEAQDDGVVAKILAEAGADEIQCGEPIMIIVQEADDVDAFKDYVLEPSSTVAASSAPPPAPEPAAPAPAPTPPPAPAAAPAPAPPPVAASGSGGGAAATTDTGKVIASPKAFMLAKEMGYDISSIAGTGPGGRVIAADVQEFVPMAVAAATADGATTTAAAAPATAAVASPVAPPIPGAGYIDYPLSVDARETAARLTMSKQNVPHYYLMADVRLDAILDLRTSLNATLKSDDDDEGITLNDLLVKASACAMKAVPSANASWMDTFVRMYDNVDINVYVGSGDGLYAPLIADAGGMGLKGISEAVKAAETSAADGTLTPETCAVGTFSVVNLGMYGIKSCAPIIVEPQACMLALGAAENRIVPNDGDGEEIYKEAVMLTATLSCDHRVVDGAVGAQWLSAFKSHVENPSTLLL